MLDTFIIDRIRRERERERERDAGRLPLRIERPPPDERPNDARKPAESDDPRGSVVIDFRL